MCTRLFPGFKSGCSLSAAVMINLLLCACKGECGWRGFDAFASVPLSKSSSTNQIFSAWEDWGQDFGQSHELIHINVNKMKNNSVWVLPRRTRRSVWFLPRRTRRLTTTYCFVNLEIEMIWYTFVLQFSLTKTGVFSGLRSNFLAGEVGLDVETSMEDSDWLCGNLQNKELQN